MRHVAGVLIGVVVTGVLLFGGGLAVQRALAASVTPTVTGDSRLWIALAAMALVGVVLGLVIAARVSPLATFVPSITLLSWTVVYALDMTRGLSLIPDEPTMHELLLNAGEGQRTLLTTGVFAMLGIALFIPVLMPSRWARREEYDEEEEYEERAESRYY